MKKVFAFLSVFALTIAFVGFSAKPANAAELMTEDPTLNENQIPMYIMDSIYTTFPAYYDYATAGDQKWPGAEVFLLPYPACRRKHSEAVLRERFYGI